MKNLEQWLEEIQVQEIDEDVAFINDTLGIIGWFAVVNEEGIIAYFGKEKHAFKFRLDYINNKLNG